jgi:hypothetical protein
VARILEVSALAFRGQEEANSGESVGRTKPRTNEFYESSLSLGGEKVGAPPDIGEKNSAAFLQQRGETSRVGVELREGSFGERPGRTPDIIVSAW